MTRLEWLATCAVVLLMAVLAFLAFDHMMDEDARHRCADDATATEAVCRQANGG